MDAPLNYFLQGHGPAASPVVMLDWVFSSICVAVCVIVTVLLLLGLFRDRSGEAPLIIEGGGLRAVTAGIVISVAVLLGMTIYMLVVLNNTAYPARPPQLALTVTAYQWWWKIAYDNENVVTANEIHIPTGTPVEIALKSGDVIHTFWVPQLAGKTQTIPGLTNRQWIEADKPGVYRGQCTEYCGVQHAHMALEVVAQPPDDFKKWLAAQQPPAAAGGAGAKLFMDNCAACHTIRGTEAKGNYGPDLTHLMSRRQIGAGLLNTDAHNLDDWVKHVQELKPGARMPDFDFSDADRAALVAYLTGLK